MRHHHESHAMLTRLLLLLLTACIGFGEESSGDIGLGPVPIGGGGAGSFSSVTDSGLTSGRVTTAGTGGLLKDYAGLAIIGTPSTTAPSVGTNGPGTVDGTVFQSDGTAMNFAAALFGNGTNVTTGLGCYAAQGTAAAPGAT